MVCNIDDVISNIIFIINYFNESAYHSGVLKNVDKLTLIKHTIDLRGPRFSAAGHSIFTVGVREAHTTP